MNPVTATDITFLLDENKTYLAEIRNLGYLVVTVRELQAGGWNKRTDYSILKLAESKGYIVVSNDREVIDACLENKIHCIPTIGLRKSAEARWVIERIKRIERIMEKKK